MAIPVEHRADANDCLGHPGDPDIRSKSLAATKQYRRWIIAGVATLIALQIVLGLRSAARHSVTVDEIFHVTGGYCFNILGDYRIHPDNGVLPQRLHALPAVLAGAKLPSLMHNEHWRANDGYVVSYQFFYRSGNDHWPLLMGARAINALFGVAIALLVFFWARRLVGDLAGFVALALACFSPTLLAHAPLATTDAAAAFFLMASAGAFWTQLRARHWSKMTVSAAVFGLACVSKYSAVLLLPIFAGLIVTHLATTARSEWRVPHIACALAVHALVAMLFIWACFGFRYSALAPGVPPAENFAITWNWLLEHAGWQGRILRWISEQQLLPEGFLFGYTHTYIGSLKRGAYLAGEFSDTGWRSFFPLAFLWKSSLAELGGATLCALAAVVRWRSLPDWLVRLAPLVALVAVYGAVAVTSRLNIGHRHLLPLYPALFIVTGVAVARLAATAAQRITVGGVFIGLQMVAALAAFPNYLAYFNVFAGGPANGWRLLVDSSLDWGQDLPALAQWLGENNTGPNAAPVFLSYFGSGEPEYYNLRVHRLPFINGFKLPTQHVKLEAGVYCISATTLAQVYSPFRGAWTLEFEKEYQTLRALEPLFDEYTQNPSRRAELNREVTAAQWRAGWERYALLRFARLCSFLRMRSPDDNVGDSILIYRLDAAEVSRATAASLSSWPASIKKSIVPEQ